MHEAGLAAPVDRPARRQLVRGLERRARFGIQHATGCDEREGEFQCVPEQGRVERRIEGIPRRSCPARGWPAKRIASASAISTARPRACLDRPQLPCRGADAVSTSTTRAAPREAASKPSAPVPANRSRQRKPSSVCPRPVEYGFAHAIGRRTQSVDRGDRQRRRFQMPPMMRTCWGAWRSLTAGRGGVATGLTGRGMMNSVKTRNYARCRLARAVMESVGAAPARAPHPLRISPLLRFAFIDPTP